MCLFFFFSLQNENCCTTPLSQQQTSDLGLLALQRSVKSLRDGKFDSLPGTRQEAEAILKLIPEDTQKTYAFDFDANLRTATNPQLRGFMYAGSPRALVSLWKVDDQATAEIMTRFYRLMLENKLSPAEALREAQLEMQRETEWKSPYYWAAFTLQGEWR